MNKVYIAGRHVGDFNLSGQAVAGVRNLFNGQVTAGMQCYVGGRQANDTTIVGAGQDVSFQKTAGVKG